jgi:hypothetical protein
MIVRLKGFRRGLVGHERVAAVLMVCMKSSRSRERWKAFIRSTQLDALLPAAISYKCGIMGCVVSEGRVCGGNAPSLGGSSPKVQQSIDAAAVMVTCMMHPTD